MQRRVPDRKLESFKIFPYIAWGLIILFVIFVYSLTTQLNSKAGELDKRSDILQEAVNTETSELQYLDFEK